MPHTLRQRSDPRAPNPINVTRYEEVPAVPRKSPAYIIPLDETRAITFERVGPPIVGVPQMYELLKPDGTRSGANSYDAISRLQGHLGGRIVKAGEEN